MKAIAAELGRQLQSSWRVLALICIPTLVLLNLLRHATDDHFIGVLTRDPNVVMGVPFYVGAISNVGVVLWASTAAVCLLTAAALKGDHRETEARGFLLFAGCFTAVLAFDDLLQLHEGVFRHYILGIREEIIFAIYAVLAATMLIRFRRTILASEHIILLAAFSFFAVALVADVVFWRAPFFWRFATNTFEDGAKLLGILCWVTYFFRFSLGRLVSLRASADWTARR